MKKLSFCIVIILVCLTLLASLQGCVNLPDKMEISIDEGEKIALLERAEGEWYTYYTEQPKPMIEITDPSGKNQSVELSGSANGKYVITVKKTAKGKYEIEALPQKRAIIWVTALLSGGLYDAETNTAVWDPLPYEDVYLSKFVNPDTMLNEGINVVMRLFTDRKTVTYVDENGDEQIKSTTAFNELVDPISGNVQDKSNFIWNVGLDYNGVPHNPNIKAANSFDSKVQYGVLGAYIDHSQYLNAEYEEDFIVFNYDWRLDNRESVEALEDYINDNNYTDVVLFSHSLGGNIVAGYLAKNQYNRDRVTRYVSMGGAFLGSFDALYTLEDIGSYLMAVVENMDMDLSSLSTLLKLVKVENLEVVVEQLQDFIVNMPSFIQLLPSYALISGKQYQEGGDGVAYTIDGNAITTEEELYSFYESRPWAWQRDENGEYIFENGKHVVREVVKELKEYHDSLYVTLENGEKVFAATLVDTYYVTGTGITSFCGADYVSNGSGDYDITVRTSTNGDKQVLFYSGIVNQDEELLKANGKLITFPGQDHFQVGCTWELVGGVVRRMIDEAFYG